MMSRFRSFEVHFGCGHWMSGTGASPGPPFFCFDTWSPTQLRKQVSQKRWEQLVITGLIITKVHSGQTNWLLDPSASSCLGTMRRRPCLSSTSEGRFETCEGCSCSSAAFHCCRVPDVSTFPGDWSGGHPVLPGVAPVPAAVPGGAVEVGPAEPPVASWVFAPDAAGNVAAPAPKAAPDCALKRRAALAPLTSQAELPFGVAIPVFGVFTTEREGGFIGPGTRVPGPRCFGVTVCEALYTGDPASSRCTR
mmetsp:Transcript_21410/g.64261  ORF Transcript_21410/g.64261 Transcript_21410/m.64261 type:complete len:250 (+) Transcript_21410:911-1660(+)